MTKLVKVVCDVAAIRGRYICAHHEIFHLSARKLARLLNRDLPDPYAGEMAGLEELLPQLRAAQAELEKLTESDVSVRRGKEIQRGLADYIDALAHSVEILKTIAALMHQRAVKDKMYDAKRLQRLRVAYDDALQHHKRLGALLNTLISAL